MPRMMLLTKELENQIPLIGTTDKNPDPMVWVKWFTPDSSYTWYITERNPHTGRCFGVTVNPASNMPWELGYFDQKEIESVRGKLGLPVERDKWFKPQPLSQVKAKEEHLFQVDPPSATEDAPQPLSLPPLRPLSPAPELSKPVEEEPLPKPESQERISQPPRRKADPKHIYVYNAQVQAHAIGLAWDPESDVAFYLSAAGSKNALRSIWTSMLVRDNKDPELKMHNGWTDQNAFKGPSSGVHQNMVGLKNTALWHGVFFDRSPYFLFIEDAEGAYYPDSNDPDHFDVRYELQQKHLPEVQKHLVRRINDWSNIPVDPSWGAELWQVGIDHDILKPLECHGDCVGAWLIDSTANWLYYVQQALKEGRLSIKPMI